MQIDTEWLGTATFGLMLATWVTTTLIVIAIIAMHFLMPKAVLEKYFRPPYFREFECMLFSGIPYAHMRTIMFMRAIANPLSGKTRGITQAHLLVPRWYRISSRALMTSIYVNSVLLLTWILIGGWFYFTDA